MSVEPEEIIDARRLKPVEWDVALPPRKSVTLIKKADTCPRDAGMYLRYQGGSQSGPLLRGSLFHLFAERAMAQLMLAGEKSLVALQPGEDAMSAFEAVSQTTKEWVNALADETQWPLTEEDIDDVRVMAYHWAIGQDVDPGHVVALERKFVLETPDGILSGKVDVGALLPDGTLDVVDYKSSFYVPPDADYARMVQVPLYGALILWGRPVDRVPCARCEGTGQIVAVDAPAEIVFPYVCPDCVARGTVEVIGEPLGLEHVQRVRARQVYPRHLRERESGPQLDYRERYLTRAELQDKLAGAQRAMRRVNHGVATREWPAVSGAHCSECTCEAECPLPSQLRRFAGTIESPEQASEAMEWAERIDARSKATKAEVKAFVKAHDSELRGRLPVGAREYAFVVSHPKSLKKRGQRTDWEGLEGAVQDAAFNGAVFDIDDWVRVGTKTEFKELKERE